MYFVGRAFDVSGGLALGLFWAVAGTAIYVTLLAAVNAERLRELRVGAVAIQTAALGIALGILFLILASSLRGDLPWAKVLAAAVAYVGITGVTDATLATWHRVGRRLAASGAGRET